MNYLRLIAKYFLLIFLLSVSKVNAYPAQAELFGLSESMVHIWVTYGDGVTGTGSGVVVKENHVATDCHVFADSKGVNVVKYFKQYVPVAVYADWGHDLCILKFDDLPLPAVNMGKTESISYEDKVFSLTFPNDSPVPLPSYGKVKGLHAFEGGNIIRTSATFTVGSSGGALFDLDFNLLGITTFKSPGKRLGHFYCLPVEWINELLKKEPQLDLKSTAAPFWSLPDAEKPFFMQVIVPMQQENWLEMRKIAKAWAEAEKSSPDAWYYLGFAESKLNNISDAMKDFNNALALNKKHLDSLSELYAIAVMQKNTDFQKTLIDQMRVIDSDYVEYFLQANS